ncbi:hypothetical protein [Aquicella lusitana]|uniref:Uncharacterized protein n=1 Tax=Aquicella lusitana TaxID=254246 RepID=A0A370H152_9COXI|nr:hypothetical protein [Aquicella lusitana]RDI48725.1 hypothetical protein C8D86_1012 [Aquicella lusitana]VVC73153.1 hypothetical protein AQULUS_08840 [Aquicella lusitana]
MLTRLMNQFFSAGAIILSMILVNAVYASDSTQLVVPRLAAQTLKPTTTDQSAPVTMDPSSNASLSCPQGYALTNISATAQTKESVKVYRECNGVSAAGYVHTWCKNNLQTYNPVKSAPKGTYVCRKIINKWEPV